MAQILLLNGPNLNLLGKREPHLYGPDTLVAIEKHVAAIAKQMGHELDAFQSNHEGALIDRIQKAASDGTAIMIFNPGGYTHTSIALRDALLAVALPFIEVHISNPQRREHFRRHSYFTDISAGTVTGFGALGYELALVAAARRLAAQAANPQN
ncbi:MAG TPA: type II 3-dehydroquinate dehydratase [Gammaproteobacteria bacterium]|nr:type II 3-dehydroquinate dehydratase [Gammaproteobacteria bacterium]